LGKTSVTQQFAQNIAEKQNSGRYSVGLEDYTGWTKISHYYLINKIILKPLNKARFFIELECKKHINTVNWY